MWIRSEVKAQGKANFKKNYGKSVLVGFIYSLFFMATGAATSTSREKVSSEQVVNDPNFIAVLLAVVAAIAVLVVIIKLVDIFVLNPLEVGCNRFFLVNQKETAELNELGHAFQNNYVGAITGLFLRDLLIGLGFIAFIIPGCILTYSYRMVPYILAEDPQISGVDALKKSREMMLGHKWATFVYDLSFILWHLLSAVTCGLVSVFYVTPYKLNSDAALYQAIKNS